MPPMRSYWAKVAVLWSVIFIAFLITGVEFMTPFPQWIRRVPGPLLGFVLFLLFYGWTVIAAAVLASIWQLVQGR